MSNPIVLHVAGISGVAGSGVPRAASMPVVIRLDQGWHAAGKLSHMPMRAAKSSYPYVCLTLRACTCFAGCLAS